MYNFSSRHGSIDILKATHYCWCSTRLLNLISRLKLCAGCCSICIRRLYSCSSFKLWSNIWTHSDCRLCFVILQHESIRMHLTNWSSNRCNHWRIFSLLSLCCRNKYFRILIKHLLHLWYLIKWKYNADYILKRAYYNWNSCRLLSLISWLKLCAKYDTIQPSRIFKSCSGRLCNLIYTYARFRMLIIIVSNQILRLHNSFRCLDWSNFWYCFTNGD